MFQESKRLEDYRNVINIMSKDQNNPNYDQLNKLRIARNNFFDVYEKIFKDRPLFLQKVSKIISDITLESCDLIFRNDIINIFNNSKELELTEEQKAYIIITMKGINEFH